MKTKVNNCGNYECAHCSNAGTCTATSISIDQNGKCITFRPPAYSREAVDPMYEHTNMC